MYVAIIHKDRVLEIVQSETEYANAIRSYKRLGGYEDLKFMGLVTDVEAFVAFSNGKELAPRVKVEDGTVKNFLKVVK